MAMTIVVKDELSRVELARPCCRKAEVSALLRFAGHLWLSAGRIVLEAELDTAAAARRLEAGISAMFGHPAEVVMVEPPGGRKGNSYLVRVTRGRAGESLARQAGLIDSGRCPVRGLPRQVVSGAACDCAAAWRGAFLARGSLASPGRHVPALEISCPGPEAALALVGAARRMRVHAKAREVRGADRAVISNGDAIAAMLARLGAHEAVLAWEEQARAAAAARRTSPGDSRKAANLDGANLSRSEHAASAQAALAERALQILGDDVPGHLAAAGRLRVAHRAAGLAALGQMADPPLSKDAIAGRIRRLVAMADHRAADQEIPRTGTRPSPGIAPSVGARQAIRDPRKIPASAWPTAGQSPGHQTPGLIEPN